MKPLFENNAFQPSAGLNMLTLRKGMDSVFVDSGYKAAV